MNSKVNTNQLVKQLKELLLKGHAHASVDDALKKIPVKLRGITPDKLPYSIWQLAEHLRLAQWDILDFSRNPKYKPMKWPADYWPGEKAPKDAAAWNNTIKKIKQDRKDFAALLEKKNADLLKPFPWGQGQNLLGEALLIADHNSYHIGEIIVVRRLLDDWK